jgi:hypothetical protein
VSSAVNGLAPWLRPYAEWLLYYYPQLRVTSVYRSRTDQLRLWNNRASNPYPVAPPGSSKHELRRAWDMVGPDDVLEAAGRTWESWGGTWGGRFGRTDPIHFEA